MKTKIKRQILAVATLACISLVGVSAVVAKHRHHEDPMRIFTKLDLSDQQKQEIKAIFKATRENNSVYASEKEENAAQMHDLMSMPSWDQSSAETIIRLQLQQNAEIALNKAKARHQVFNLLSDEQKLALAEKESRRGERKADKQQRMASHDVDDKKGDKSKGKHKGKAGKMHLGRLAKALHLTDAQLEQFNTIDAAAKQQMLALKAQSSDHRDLMRTIVQSASFDEDVWIAEYNSALDNKLAFKLIQTKAHYDRVSLLTDEQQEKFAKIMKKMKEKGGKRGFNKQGDL